MDNFLEESMGRRGSSACNLFSRTFVTPQYFVNEICKICCFNAVILKISLTPQKLMQKRRSTPGDKWEVEMEVDTRRKTSVTFSAKFNGENSAERTDGRTNGRTDERTEFPPKFRRQIDLKRYLQQEISLKSRH